MYWCVRFWSIDRRAAAGFLFSAFTAFGSFLFHATIRFYAELLDELPMVYGTCVSLVSLYGVYENTNGRAEGKDTWLVASLTGFCVVFTIVMLAFKSFYLPFIVAYAGLTMLVVVLSAVLIRRMPDETAWKLLLGGIIQFATAFVFWVSPRSSLSVS